VPVLPILRPLEPPAFDEAGYEAVGGCLHPRIATDLFSFKQRDREKMEPCPYFRPNAR
jgi:hypothetical protein